MLVTNFDFCFLFLIISRIWGLYGELEITMLVYQRVGVFFLKAPNFFVVQSMVVSGSPNRW